MPSSRNLKIIAVIVALIAFGLIAKTLSGSLGSYAEERRFGTVVRIALIAGGWLLSLIWLVFQLYTSFRVINRVTNSAQRH